MRFENFKLFDTITCTNYNLAFCFQVKTMAKDNLFRPASAIVNQAWGDVMGDRDDGLQIPNPANLKRAANRVRQKLRPAEPKDLATFEVKVYISLCTDIQKGINILVIFRT